MLTPPTTAPTQGRCADPHLTDIDLLSRSLLSGFLPLQAARGIVSHGLNALPPLRRLVMRIGMMPPTELPEP
mgnify:CR=1 FL=1